jgi:hypothetical protein
MNFSSLRISKHPPEALLTSQPLLEVEAAVQASFRVNIADQTAAPRVDEIYFPDWSGGESSIHRNTSSRFLISTQSRMPPVVFGRNEKNRACIPLFQDAISTLRA